MGNKRTEQYNAVFGLTGILGSGKSTVALLLSQKGAVVINADDLAKEVVSAEYDRRPQVYERLKKELEPIALSTGPSIFKDGLLDRVRTAEVVFSDPQALSILNSIVHAEVARLFAVKIEKIEAGGVIVYDVPLLFETDIHLHTKKNIVVYAPEEIAIERASKRMGITVADAQKRVKNQISIEKKRKMADYVIENVSDMDSLKLEVDKLWNYLLENVHQTN